MGHILSLNESLPWNIELAGKFETNGPGVLSHNKSLPWSYDFIENEIVKSLPWSENFIEKFEDRWDWSSLSGNIRLIQLIEKYVINGIGKL
jgi:hypothetical protein